MTDETPKKRTRRRPAAADGSSPASGASGKPDDPDAALERLASMGSDPAADQEPLPPKPAVSSFANPRPSRPTRPVGSTQRASRARPRPAAGPSSTRVVARVAAPVVFLVAVIAFVGIVAQSGVMSGSSDPTPAATISATKSTTVTKKYVVKSGDSMSSIAERFNTTVDVLQTLNPDLSSTTLVVGTRIVVPR